MNNKERILKVKFTIQEFLKDKGWFSIDDLYYFFYGIEYFNKNELLKITNFLIKGKDVPAYEEDGAYRKLAKYNFF